MLFVKFKIYTYHNIKVILSMETLQVELLKMLKQSVISRQKQKYHRNTHEILNMEAAYLEILQVWRQLIEKQQW